MNVLLFGAGTRGNLYYERIKSSDLSVLAFIDNNESLVGTYIESIPIASPKNISSFPFDKIIITTIEEKSIAEILEQLKSYDIGEDKIEILSYTSFNPYDEDTNSRVIWLRDFAHYVYSNGISGSVAECGVYRGEFSRFINKYFPDRTLYLFDTFEGFVKKEIDIELSFNNDAFAKSIYSQDDTIFKATDIEHVMRHMPYPENCIIKQGVLPDTTTDVHDSFCFINLDMDLYQPMLAGLNFFWGKMASGGVMLLHDYFDPSLPGVARAVEDFEKIMRRRISKTTIGDFCSIALIKD